jgi:hypothetical protein
MSKPQSTKDRRKGLTDEDICRANGWYVGTRLVGDEGYGPTVIEIHAFEDGKIRARTISHDGKPGERRVSSWCLDCREWFPVEQVRSALSDLTASTPTVDGPEGLTGPSSEGTWYGLWAEVPLEGWELRTDGTAEWHKPMDTAMPVNSVVEARPVPLPVTEEVPLDAFGVNVLDRRLPGERERVEVISCSKDGFAWRAESWAPGAWRPLPVTPSGMVTVQREGDEK